MPQETLKQNEYKTIKNGESGLNEDNYLRRSENKTQTELF